jgi:hypothetical protein
MKRGGINTAWANAWRSRFRLRSFLIRRRTGRKLIATLAETFHGLVTFLLPPLPVFIRCRFDTDISAMFPKRVEAYRSLGGAAVVPKSVDTLHALCFGEGFANYLGDAIPFSPVTCALDGPDCMQRVLTFGKPI